MTQRFALGLQYDGRDWLGWQSQPEKRTIQDRLEDALSRFADEPVRVVAAGRTDAGVHAVGQVVHFESGAKRASHSWTRALNSLLPASISTTWVQPVVPEFHARYGAIARTYHYVLYVNPARCAHAAGRIGWCYQELDIAAMREAAKALLGEHDFSALRSAQCQAKSPVRTLYALDIGQTGPFLLITLRANAFLHHMVRNIVGCLVRVGARKEPASWMQWVLEGRDRAQAAPTFMADGLYLGHIEYPPNFLLPASPGLEIAFPSLYSPS